MQAMEALFKVSDHLISKVDTRFVRYAAANINWQNRLIGLTGPRGVGKTTLVLQHMRLHLDRQKSLYVTAEDFYFARHRLTDLAEQFVKAGGRHLVIDEIHKYPDWSVELKLMHDYHPELQVIFTGSSVLDLKKGSADLSRRAVLYPMQGLSFREYLHLFEGQQFPVYELEEILAQQVNFSGLDAPLSAFGRYLQNGYYPFALEADFDQRLKQVVGQTLEVDIPSFAQMNVSTGRKLKQLLAIVAQSVPFKPNMSKIADLLFVSRNNIADYLLYIEEAGMIAQLRSQTAGIRGLAKIDKVYLDNPNLCFALASENANMGNIRETFFLNQTRVLHEVRSSNFADFTIAGYDFEVGGKSKGLKQILQAPKGVVVKDDIERGYLQVVPLWHFGFLY
jgi:uncharacterized protein